MKNLFLALVLCLSAGAFAQIELVDTVKTEVDSRISYAFIEKTGEDQYSFNYKDMNSSAHEYVKFTYRDISNAHNTLFAIMTQGFTDVPRDPVKFKAGGDKYVWLKYLRGVDEKVYMNILMMTDSTEENATAQTMAVSKGFTAEDIKALFKK